MSLSSDRKLLIKAIIIGVFASVAMIAIIMCLICVIFLTTSKLPYEYVEYIMLLADAIGVFIGSCIAARIAGKNGLLTGVISSGIVMISLLIAGFSTSFDSLTLTTLLRILVMLIAGAAGGIRGVNRKEKIRIK